jgi:hypothetical protein
MKADFELDAGTRTFASGLLPELIAALRRARLGDLIAVVSTRASIGVDLETWCRLQFADIANGKPVPVIGPSFDGGYYLIGVRRAHAELFHAIDWSTAQVAAQTRQRALGLGLEVLDLDAWYDVDDAHSLQRLVYELASSQTVNATAAYPAPVTRAFLEQKALADRLATRVVAMMPSPAGGSRSHSLRNLDAAKSSS